MIFHWGRVLQLEVGEKVKLKKMLLPVFLSALGFYGCSKDSEPGLENGVPVLTGTVLVDGSSTVFPITEAVAEEFQKQQKKVRVSVGVSGTGGGFKKFLQGETDINDASRPIKATEIKVAQEQGIRYLEVPVAYDGLTVVVNKENDFVDYLTVAELNKIWEPGSKVNSWSEIRQEWPNQRIRLYGPGTDSGTFDYFTETINGKSGASRVDFTASEDDNVLVKGVSGDKYALAFFGYAYYKENKGKLRAVPIDGGNGPVVPTMETINQGTYEPLSRPVFIYINEDKLTRQEVVAFVNFYLTNAAVLSEEVGYIALPAASYQESLSRVARAVN